MKITNIVLSNFRCFTFLELQMGQNINILCGSNASGKTSVLEAIHYLVTTRSNKTSDFRDSINRKCEQSLVKGVFKTKNTEKTAFVLISKYLKKFGQNGVEIKKATDYFGFSKIVSFNNDDLTVPVGNPSSRRKMFDFMMCQLNDTFLKKLSLYKKMIKEKNSLLKKVNVFGEKEEILLNILNNEIYELSQYISKCRIDFINEINLKLKKIYKRFNHGSEEVEIEYKQSFPYGATLEDYLSYNDKELLEKTSVVGSHRDDYVFMIDGINSSKHASQGQIKSMMVLLKIVYAIVVKEKTGVNPVVLLDDVFGELDKNRQNSVLEILDSDTQVLITTPSISEINDEILRKANIIYLEKGGIRV